MYRDNNSKRPANPVARNAPWPHGIHLDFLQAETGSGTKTTYPSCSLPVGYRTVCLFLHENTEDGLQQGLVGVRSRGYFPEEYQTQALQFLNKPEDALTNLPSTLLVHSVGQGMADSPAQLHSVSSFLACEHDPNPTGARPSPGADPARLCMEHTSLVEAKQLLVAITDRTSDRRRGYGRIQLPEIPSSLEHDGASPCHVVAWALLIIELLPPKVLLGRLIHWEQKTAARVWPNGDPHATYPLHEPLRDIESLDDVQLFNESHWIFMKLTLIRLSSVEGNRRYFTSFYFLSECLRSIGLALHLLDAAERASVRRILNEQQYGMTVFLPPAADRPSKMYSPADVMSAKAVGFWKQQNLAHALPVGATDKFVHHCKMNALMMTHQPWQGNDTTGKEFIVNQKKKANDAIIPQPYALPAKKDGTTKGEATTVGIGGNLRRHVFTLLHSELRGLATGHERRTLVKELVPDVLVEKLENFLSRNNFADWKTRPKATGPLKALTIKQCSCSVISNFFTHFTHFFQDGHIAKHLADWQGGNSALFVDSKDEMDETLALAKMLYSFYYLPGRALLDQVDMSSNNKDNRCPWIQFMRETSLYSELSTLYANSVEYLLPDRRRIDVKTLCIVLEHLIRNQVLLTRVDPRLAIKSKLTVASDLGTRYFPRCSLHEFVPQFANPEEPTKWWFTLTDIAAGNITWLNEKLVSHPYLKPIQMPPPAAPAPPAAPTPAAADSSPKPPPPAETIAAVPAAMAGTAVAAAAHASDFDSEADLKPAAVVSPPPKLPKVDSEQYYSEDDDDYYADPDGQDDDEVDAGGESEERAAATNLLAMGRTTTQDSPTQQHSQTVANETDEDPPVVTAVPQSTTVEGSVSTVEGSVSTGESKEKDTEMDSPMHQPPVVAAVPQSTMAEGSVSTGESKEKETATNGNATKDVDEPKRTGAEEDKAVANVLDLSTESQEVSTNESSNKQPAKETDFVGSGGSNEQPAKEKELDSSGEGPADDPPEAQSNPDGDGATETPPRKKRKRRTHVHMPNVKLRPAQREMCAQLDDFLSKYGDKAFMEVGREAFRQDNKTAAKKVFSNFRNKGRKGRKKGR